MAGKHNLTFPILWDEKSAVAEAMRGIKGALDPGGLLNPGVLFSDAPWWETWAGLDERVPM